MKRKLRTKSIKLAATVPWTLRCPIPASLGPACERLGITEEVLTGTTEFAVVKINNGAIMELRSHWAKKNFQWHVFCRWLHLLKLSDNVLPEDSVRQRINRLHQKYTDLSKHSKRELNDLLKKDFILPQCTLSRFHAGDEPINSSGPAVVNQQPSTIEIQTFPPTSVEKDISIIEPVNEPVNGTLQCGISQIRSQTRGKYETQIGDLQQTLAKSLLDLQSCKCDLQRVNKNHKRRQERRDQKIDKLEVTIGKLQEELADAQEVASEAMRCEIKEKKYYKDRSCALQSEAKQLKAIITTDGAIPIGREKENPGCRRDYSAVTELIKATCSLLTASGHPAAGIPEDFQAWMGERGKKILFVPFAHNRFNMLFHNASAAYHHHKDVRQFLGEVSYRSNQLIEAVKGDMADDLLVACVRGVAIFHLYITRPFHGLVLSNKKRHVMDLNPYLTKMRSVLETLSANPWWIFELKFCMWEDHEANEDDLFQSVIPSSKEEPDLQISMEVLSLVATHCLVTFTRQVAPQLPGGEHAVESSSLREESTSVLTSNSIGKSNFALLKHLRKFRPNANTENVEGTIMWACNKTLEWLQSLSDPKRCELLEVGRKKTREFKEMWCERRKLLKEQRLEDLRKKEEREEQKCQKQASDRQKCLDAVTDMGGQMRSGEDVDVLVEQCPNPKDLLLKLKEQIRFFKTVVKSPVVHKDLYFFSRQGKQFTCKQLESNLKTIIHQHQQFLESSQPAPTLIPSPAVRQPQIDKAKKIVLCNYATMSDQPSTSTAPKKGKKRKPNFPDDPIGRRFRHRWELGKTKKWYCGKVLAVAGAQDKPSFPGDEDDNVATGAMYKLYHVAYDRELETYNLRVEKDHIREDLNFIDEETGDDE